MGSVTVSDTTPNTGESITLSTTVRNSGSASSASTTLRWYRSANSQISSFDSQVGTDSVSGLSAGGSGSESITISGPSTAGTYYYGACVDSVSGESSTGDNCSSGRLVTVSSSGGGGGNACMVGNTIAIGSSCTVGSSTLTVVSSGCVTYSAFGSGTICSVSFSLNGLEGNRNSDGSFTITAIP